MKLFPPRRSAPTPAPEPKHQSANPLFGQEAQQLSIWRTRVIGLTLGVLICAGVIWLVFGSWSRISNIQIRGNVFITRASLEQVARYELDRPVWGWFPRQQRLFFSTTGLAKNITRRITARVAIAGLTVSFVDRHTIAVTVRERLPVALWSNGVRQGWLDQEGKIVNLGPAPAGMTLPVVLDESRLIFAVDDQAVNPGVVQGLTTLNDALIKGHFVVEEYRLPVQTCLPDSVIASPDTNANANTNTAHSSTNTNVSGSTNVNLNQNVSVNTNSVAGPGSEACQAEALRLQRPEIDAQLKDGPLVRFDRYTNLVESVTTLERLLAEKANSGAKNIDLRFGERVYIK